MTLQRLHDPPHPHEEEKDPGRLGSAGLHQAFPVMADLPRRAGPAVLPAAAAHVLAGHEAETESAQTAARLEELAQQVAAGACFGCGQPITTRQAVIEYRESNAQIPLAAGPVFHARASCREFVVAYERCRATVHPDSLPIVDVRTHALLRDNDGRLLGHPPDSYHAAFLRAVALDGVDPRKGARRAHDGGRRDLWRSPTAARRTCRCGRGPVTHTGGVNAIALTSGCLTCITAWVERADAPSRP